VADLGDFALRLALLVTVAGLLAGLVAARSGHDPARREVWTRAAIRSVLVVFVFTSLAMALLFHAFWSCDYQIEYVAAHSARSMTTPYRLAALWGGQAGSLLLWLWMLGAYGSAAVLSQRGRSRTLLPWVCSVLLANAGFFLVLLVFVTNPFAKLPPEQVLSDGNGLNPLLQHPAMMIHPLMLYTGLTGFVVPFAFGCAALATGELGTAWLRSTRRWTLVAWLFLSIGILLGGRWAYEVLGWGGYWAWDPVENASFMPWLAATAYLHSVMIQEKRDMLKIWNLVLIGLTYTLCLFGTMLTRSGLVRSVHAFAQTEIFGILFLGYVVGTALLFFGLLAWRRGALRSTSRLESLVSRESGFIFNNWAFMGLLAIVFWGTLYPKVSDWLRGEEILLGPSWFNMLSMPVALFLLLLTGIGPLVAWRRASLANLRRQFVAPGLAGLATAAALGVAFRGDVAFFPLATWSLCAFVTATVLQEYARAIRARVRGRGENPAQALAALLRKNQRRYGGYVVHLGVVCILAGIAGAAFNEERLENVKPGGSIALDGYLLEYRTARSIPRQHYGGAVARLALYRDGEPVATMAPEKRMYWLEQQPASIPSVYSTLREDLYVILAAIEPDGSATFKVYRNPLVNWIWIGGFTFVLGTLLVIWPHPPRRTESPAA
jgi:cytochrome c-type biogenesis protein CcmF